MKPIRQAVILAGGLGTRLRPLTLTTPKPMIPIRGKPFLVYLMKLLKENQIKEVLILVGYLHQKIEDFFSDGKKFGLNIKYSYSPAGNDTGTRLTQALPALDNKFLLMYGDNYWPLKLDELSAFYIKKKKKALVTIYSNLDNSTKNNILVDDQGLVLDYDRSRTKKNLNGVDIGFFLLDKKIFVNLPKSDFSFEDVVIPKLIRDQQLAGFLTHHKYYGLSNFDRIPDITDYFRPQKVVFLDRDGIINKRPPKGQYVTSWKEFDFLSKTKDALRLLYKKGYEIYIVSNQAGIARKKVTSKQVEAINDRLREELNQFGVKITDIFICPHGWDEGCFCRKPNPGLLFRAASRYNLSLFDSFCIGDDLRDIQAGKLAGCKTILIGDDAQRNKFMSSQKPDFIYKNLYEAAQHL